MQKKIVQCLLVSLILNQMNDFDLSPMQCALSTGVLERVEFWCSEESAGEDRTKPLLLYYKIMWNENFEPNQEITYKKSVDKHSKLLKASKKKRTGKYGYSELTPIFIFGKESNFNIFFFLIICISCDVTYWNNCRNQEVHQLLISYLLVATLRYE